MSVLSKQGAFSDTANTTTFYERINREWHKTDLQFFMFIAPAHWAENLAREVSIDLAS